MRKPILGNSRPIARLKQQKFSLQWTKALKPSNALLIVTQMPPHKSVKYNKAIKFNSYTNIRQSAMLEIKFRALNSNFGRFPEPWFRQFLSEYDMITINPWWFSSILSCFATIENHGSAGTKVSLWQTLLGLKGLMSFPAESFWFYSSVYVRNEIEIIFTEDLKLTCKNTLGITIWNVGYDGLP